MNASATAMPSRPMGSSGLRVSALGLGCVMFGREIDRHAAWSILDRAVEAGMTLLDTAAAYGDGASETIVGEWLADRRDPRRLVVATKVHLPLTREHLERSVAESLRRLRVERLALLQLHGWDEGTPLVETCDVLAGLQRRGLVAHVGCSNFSAAQLRDALSIQAERGYPPFVSVQPRYNLVSREVEAELLPLCAAMHVGVLTYSPLGAGFLTGKYRVGAAAPPGSRFDIAPAHRDLYFSETSFRTVARLAALADEVGVPMAELALAWAMSRPHVTSTLIGARDVGQVEQGLRARSLQLDEAIWSRLDE